MQKRDFVKAGIDIVVGAGVGIIVGNAIEIVTPQGLGRIKKITVRLGTVALIGLASTAASGYVNGIVDDFAEAIDKSKKMKNFTESTCVNGEGIFFENDKEGEDGY